MHWMNSKRLILASQSPRRKELLTQAGFQFEIRIADIDEETYPAHIQAKELPEYLAQSKAVKIFETLKDPEALVLAADSLVFLGEKIFTKPKDRNDAFHILSSLSGLTHTVITGVCLKSENSSDLISVFTEVCFETIHPDEMEYYIDNYQPFDKAGAYGIQDWLGLCKVKTINGSYSNIMGLPMETVYLLLKNRMNT